MFGGFWLAIFSLVEGIPSHVAAYGVCRPVLRVLRIVRQVLGSSQGLGGGGREP